MSSEAPARIWTVVVNWERPDDTCACLGALVRSTPPESIVVVDNGSRDESAAIVRQRFPRVKLLCRSDNGGFAKAANLGIAFALEQGAAGVFLLNNDALVDEQTLARLEAALRAPGRAGVWSAKVYQADDPARLWAIGGVYRDHNVTNLFFGEPDAGQYDDIALDFVYGCAMLLRADMLYAIGGFDERFFMYYEDVDLCLRAQAAGYSIALAPDAHVWHHGERSTSETPGLKLFYEARSRMLFYAKHLSRSQKLRFYPAEARYVAALTARRLLAGNLRGALGYLRGYWSAITS